MSRGPAFTVVGSLVVVLVAGLESVAADDGQTAPDVKAAAGNVSQIIAHRGASAERPECTVSAVRRAIDVGATAVEVDVRTSRDGKLFILHDATLDRTTNGTGPASALTLAGLQKLDAGSWFDPKFRGERIPSLIEAAQECRGRIDLLLDLKEQGDEYDRKVVGVIKEHGDPAKTIVGVRSVAQAKRFRRLLPESRQLALIPSVESIEDFAKAGVDTIRIWPRWLKGGNEPAHRVRAAGKRLHLNGTMGEYAETLDLLKLAPDSLSSDHPGRLKGTLDQIARGPSGRFRVRKLGVSFGQKDASQTVYEFVNYAANCGPGMFRVRYEELKDDIFSNFELAISGDHGRTWTDTDKWKSVKPRPDGQERRLFLYGSFFDPKNGRLLFMGNQGVLRNDHPLDGQTQNYPVYRVSNDGGRTWLFEERVIQSGRDQAGDGFSPEQPFEGVRIGSNSLTVCNAVTHRSDGAVIVPVQISHAGPDGKLYRPPGAYTYLDAAVLIGTWRDDGRLDWRLSQRLNLPPEKSLRGIFEPTVAEFPDGRLLMVCRTNSGRKWFSVSKDGGLTWAAADVWRYDDGELFYSPSSISRLIRHSSGAYCWIGNISPGHPRGNAPRYPLVIGRVDPKSLSLIRDSVTTIDTRGPADVPGVQLSNFCVHEDRRTGRFQVRVTRWNGKPSGLGPVDGSVHAFEVGL